MINCTQLICINNVFKILSLSQDFQKKIIILGISYTKLDVNFGLILTAACIKYIRVTISS